LWRLELPRVCLARYPNQPRDGSQSPPTNPPTFKPNSRSSGFPRAFGLLQLRRQWIVQ
jgi:hypothetical protein